MKKTIIILFLILLILLINTTIVQASSSITYYYGEPIIVNDENIEILSNEITIDTVNSKVNNIVYLKNTSNKEITPTLIIPINNEELSFSINNLSIKLNGVEVSYIKDTKGRYIIKTKIPAASGKKLEINYNTNNDLQNAKIIKYNLENFGNRTISKVKVNIVIDEKNIPLVEKIYPGHYTFNDNVISVEYYNYTVNAITKEVIVQKETFDNLLYGREYELSNDERNIISKWSNGDKNIEFPRDIWNMIHFCKNIRDYINVSSGVEAREIITLLKDNVSPLIYDIAAKQLSMINLENLENLDILTPVDSILCGKIVCVDFVETENGIKFSVSTN